MPGSEYYDTRYCMTAECIYQHMLTLHEMVTIERKSWQGME
jgi:hypothetical protein